MRQWRHRRNELVDLAAKLCVVSHAKLAHDGVAYFGAEVYHNACIFLVQLHLKHFLLLFVSEEHVVQYGEMSGQILLLGALEKLGERVEYVSFSN